MRNSKPLIRKTFQNQYRMLSTDTTPSLLPYFRTLQALFIGFIASIFTIGLIMIPFGSLSEDQLLHPIPTLFISVAFYSILLVFLGIFLQPKLLVKSVSPISFFRLLALFTFFFIALDLLSTWIKLPSLAEPILNDQFKQNRGIFFVAVVVVGPIMEELVFRGAILSYLLARSNRLPALLFSSVLFGLIHFSLDQIVWGSIAGIFLGYSYVKSQNIIVPIFFHILNNGIYFFLKCYEDTSSVFDLLKNLE